MAQQALDAFAVEVDFQFDAMADARSLALLTARIFTDLDGLLERETPDWVLVQGDTTSAMVAAVCAFYRRIRLGHVEAGLRTWDRWAPFPEEVNRTFIGHLADLHFAPTKWAADNLAREGVPTERIHVTGNTVVDALGQLAPALGEAIPAGLDPAVAGFIKDRRLVLVTSHRREAFGNRLDNICQALLATVERFPEAVVVYPVHLNPNVYLPVRAALGNHPRILLLDPVGYLPLLWMMKRSYLVLTDSGGIQEEAPSLGKPVLVMRTVTERPEGIEAGCARLVGVTHESILAAVCDLFENHEAYAAMTRGGNPYGDGLASVRIGEALLASNQGNRAFGCENGRPPK